MKGRRGRAARRLRIALSMAALLLFSGKALLARAAEDGQAGGAEQRWGIDQAEGAEQRWGTDQAGGTEQQWDAQQAGEELQTSLLDELDFSQAEDLLSQRTEDGGISFRQLVELLIQGEEVDKKWFVDSWKDIFFREIRESRGYMAQIVLLAAAFGLLYHFANVFEKGAISDISFYMVYLILTAMLMRSLLTMSGLIQDTLQVMLDFMRALLPAFSLTVAISTGSLTAMGFYQVTLLAIYLIETALSKVALPAIHIYLALELVNHLTREEMVSKMADLVKGAVEWALKFLFTLVMGINVVQGLLSPAIDSFRSSAIVRTASMLPGFGNSVNAVAEIMVGSGVIIKNGVGIAGILAVIALCASPAIKIGVMILLYKVSAAVIQPVSDRRISGCVSGMGEGARLLGKTMVTAMVMLLVTIALVVAATTWNR